jgi:hypothetical protein
MLPFIAVHAEFGHETSDSNEQGPGLIGGAHPVIGDSGHGSAPFRVCSRSRRDGVPSGPTVRDAPSERVTPTASRRVVTAYAIGESILAWANALRSGSNRDPAKIQGQALRRQPGRSYQRHIGGAAAAIVKDAATSVKIVVPDRALTSKIGLRPPFGKAISVGVLTIA